MDLDPQHPEATQATDTAVESATPADLLIQSRNRHFAGSPIENRWWVRRDPFATAFFNALSVTFPVGEAFFIAAVKQFREGTPDKLRREIRAFVQQEVVHGREHAIFNRHLEQSSYDLSRMDKSVTEVMKRIGTLPPIYHLVATMCIEHVTAILAAEFIANPAHLKDADEEQRNLWLWHASEEIEHKGVAYDTWLHATKDWSRWKRWKMKSKFMVLISASFTINRAKGVFDLLEQDGITGIRAWLGLARFALVGPAPFRRTILPWLQFFRPGFHPWNIDDRHLIQLAESEYEAAIMDQPADDNRVTELKDHRKRGPARKVA